MTPVCPACRASLFLDAFQCWRCGLAIRPTCRSCGEPLMVGMYACWFCHEPIVEPDGAGEAALARAAVAFPPAAPAEHVVPTAPVVRTDPAPDSVQAARVAAPPRQQPPDVLPTRVAAPPRQQRPDVLLPIVVVDRRRNSRLRFGRSLVVGIALGLLTTAGALAFEATSMRNAGVPGASVSLVRRSFSEVGCSLTYPADWTIERANRRVTFLGDELVAGRSLRGIRFVSTTLSFADAKQEIEQLENRLDAYRAISTSNSTVDGKRAIVHTFIGDDLRFEQWWVDRGKKQKALRIDLWSRPADDDAPAVDQRIVASVQLL